jgi:hypothetical protein
MFHLFQPMVDFFQPFFGHGGLGFHPGGWRR